MLPQIHRIERGCCFKLNEHKGDIASNSSNKKGILPHIHQTKRRYGLKFIKQKGDIASN